MKLIIDIDEDYYKAIWENGYIYDEDNEDIAKIIKDGTSFEAELEKIQHEIGNEFVDLQDGSEEWRSYVNDAVLSCYEIVEKRIKELKGEQEC